MTIDLHAKLEHWTMSLTLIITYWLLVAFSVIQADSDSDQVLVSYQPGSPQQCFAKFGEKGLRIDDLPGRGWDNLRNVEKLPVFAHHYSKCHTTYDGAHLLPDHMSAIPVLQSNVDTYTEVFDSVSSYSSLTASSINSESSVSSVISGYFSSDYESFKKRVVSQKAVQVRVQLRHLRYKITSHPSSTFDPAFKHQLMQIAASIQSNQIETATYLSQLLVRDYGTHYTHTTHIGAVLVKDDFLNRNKLQTTLRDKASISSGAQADFFGRVGLGFNFLPSEHERSELEMYRRATQSTSIESHGGPIFKTNMKVTEWEAGLESAMVAINREGDPIHFLIKPDTLPEIPPSSVIMVAQYVKQATDKYYSINTHRGCTDFSSSNFDHFANIDDGTCKDTSEDFTFGGVYQTCRVIQGDKLQGWLQQKNPLTQDYSCPHGYTAIQLMTGKRSFTTSKSRCHTTYQGCGFLWWSRCASGRVCEPETVTSINEYKTYWCARSTSKESTLYYFGGIYTTSTPNPLTGTHRCPIHFHSLRFTSKGRVCVSGDHELGKPQSLPFGGFHSCDTGNPLVNSMQKPYPKSCPKGFSQHLALVADNCEIRYCLRSGSLSKILQTPIQLPPYMDLPDSFINKTDNSWKNTAKQPMYAALVGASVGVGALTVFLIYCMRH